MARGIVYAACLVALLAVGQSWPADEVGGARDTRDVRGGSVDKVADAGIAAGVEDGMTDAPSDPADASAPGDAIAGVAASDDPWIRWHRPVDNPVFNTTHGNNHDPILFVEPGSEYPYHLIISHTPAAAHLWRAQVFSWSSDDWELVTDDYRIGGHYEYDDGVKVDDTYYLYEAGLVFTHTGALGEASGRWRLAGDFPSGEVDDVGVYYEDGVFHLFGEYDHEHAPGAPPHFPHRFDGTSLAHYVSPTGTGDWTLVDHAVVDPNPDGGHTFGVGDPTIAKIGQYYYIYCDRETADHPYEVVAWRAPTLSDRFEYLGPAATPRSGETDDWDNDRIQDAEVAYIAELDRFVMFVNMRDTDGDPGGDFPTLPAGHTRVVGVFYSDLQAGGALEGLA